MRFVHYYPRAMVGDGGPTIALWLWAGALSARGHAVTIIHAGGSSTSPLAKPDVATTRIAHRGRDRMLRPAGLERHLRSGDVLVLHSAYTVSNLVAAAAANRAGVPYIVVPHGAYDRRSRERRRRLKAIWGIMEGRMLERALAVHIFFESEADGVAEIASSTRFVVAPTGATLPASLWEGGGGYLAWLGRYDVQNKGIDLLLGALAVMDPFDRPKLILHGRDDTHTALDVKRMADALNLGDDVEAQGPVVGPAKVEFLRRANGYVHPARWESHSTALVENLALGVPSLVSSGAHIAPSLERAKASIVVKPREESIAQGLLQLRRIGKELGPRGREFARQELNWGPIVSSFVTQTSSLLDKV